MSTADTGDAAIAKAVVDQAKELLGEASAEAEQLDLLEQPTPEEIAEARELLGPEAGRLTVVRHARDVRRGRPAGSRNKRTDDFARYISQFGQDPAITMMQIQSTPPEVLMEASTRTVTKVIKDRLVTYEEAMSYQEAQSLRIRCAEGLMPFIHSKKPVAIDARILGVRIVEELSGRDGDRDVVDHGELRVARPEDDLPEDQAA